jgi:predicted GH43/DUF377 family glycosyl hydrolase
MLEINRTGILIKPNNARVLFRPFQFVGEGRYLKIIARVLSLTEEEADEQAKSILAEFEGRHYQLSRYFLKRFEDIKPYIFTDAEISMTRRIVLGSYFTMEYALESAALFNPSMVWHPDQNDLPEGSRRFVVSLRAVGEGHLSSLSFHTGIVDNKNQITLDEDSPFVTAPDPVPHTTYEKKLFVRKLQELVQTSDGQFSNAPPELLILLPDTFTLTELQQAVETLRRANRNKPAEFDLSVKGVMMLALANYEIEYPANTNLTERIIFPYSPTEQNGIEDARFVRFTDDDGSVRYYATYTAYDGRVALPQILETEDFTHFRVSTLNGPEVRNKGMALFPRKINGLFAMISRQDNENIYLMYSDSLHFWYTKQILLKPTYPWEFVQLGNCGSPIEIDEGWLVLSHGVGAMRKYSIGAFLLDKNDPGKVLGRTREPILSPNAQEREGYVPNVVYSCGGVIHGRELIVPYAMSDYASSFFTVSVDDVLEAMN